MTTEQRFSQIEHFLAGHIEQAKKDYEENRRLWREMKEEQAERDRKYDARVAELRDEMAERDRQADARLAALDERIGKLVSSIGELIQRL